MLLHHHICFFVSLTVLFFLKGFNNVHFLLCQKICCWGEGYNYIDIHIHTWGIWLKALVYFVLILCHRGATNTTWRMLLHKHFFMKSIYNFLVKSVIIIAPTAMENRLAIVHVKRTHYGVGFGREGQTDRDWDGGSGRQTKWWAR